MRHQEELQKIFKGFFINCFNDRLSSSTTALGECIISKYMYEDPICIAEKYDFIIEYKSIDYFPDIENQKIVQFFDWIKYCWVIINIEENDFFYINTNNWSYDYNKKVIKIEKSVHKIKTWKELKKFASKE